LGFVRSEPNRGAYQGARCWRAVDEVLAALATMEPRAYLLHHHADADAVGAAIALARRWPGMLATHTSVSAAGLRMAKHFGVEVLVDPPLEDIALGVAVDSGSPGPLGPLPEGLPLVVIDHHKWAGDDVWPGLLARLVDPEATSTCEVVLPLLWALGEGLEPDEALALLCGLVADTQRFRRATKDTLTAAFVMLDHGAELRDALALLEVPSPEERSERLARLKAAQRAQVEEVAGLVVAWSHLGAFEASAANGLVALGADIAFVAAQRGSETSVSARVRGGLEAKVDAASLMQRTAKDLGPGWSGGGHAGAAGLVGPGPPEAALDACRATLARKGGL